MAERWIQSAIKNPGALRAQARREGAITKRGTISREWLEEKAEQGGTVGRRARLALTLRGLNRGRRKRSQPREVEMAVRAVRRAAGK